MPAGRLYNSRRRRGYSTKSKSRRGLTRAQSKSVRLIANKVAQGLCEKSSLFGWMKINNSYIIKVIT